MTSFKEQWSLEMALEVLKNENVGSETWSEAAKWLMLYGPPELQEIMKNAAGIATKSCFPNLEPDSYTDSGDPCYNVEKVAEALGISSEEAREKISEMENEQGIKHLFEYSETIKVQ
jgi:hypothetical protein